MKRFETVTKVQVGLQRLEDVHVRAWHCDTVSRFLTKWGVHPDTVESLYAAHVNGNDLYFMYWDAYNLKLEAWTNAGVTDDARIQEVYEACEYLSDRSWNVLDMVRLIVLDRSTSRSSCRGGAQ